MLVQIVIAGKPVKLQIEKARYQKPDNLAVSAYCWSPAEGDIPGFWEPYCKLSVNPGEELPDGTFAFNDYQPNGNELYDQFKRVGVIVDVGDEESVDLGGHVGMVPLVTLTNLGKRIADAETYTGDPNEYPGEVLREDSGYISTVEPVDSDPQN